MKSSCMRMAAAIAATVIPLTAEAVDYDVQRIDLRPANSPLTNILEINAQGQLLGFTGTGQIGLLTGSTLTTVKLPGAGQIGDLSDNGTALVYYSGSSNGSYASHAYTFSAQHGLAEIRATSSQVVTLTSLPPPVTSSAGHVLMNGSSSWPGTVLSQPDGSFARLPFPANGGATGVNANGVVVGYTTNSGRTSSAAYWSAASGLQPLGNMGGSMAYLLRVTDSGLALGRRAPPVLGQPDSFVYSLASGETRFIDGLTAAEYIDEAGRVYGFSASGEGYAVWDNGELTALDPLVGPATDPDHSYNLADVSSDGRVLITDYRSVAFILRPVPEPGTYVLTGIGLAAGAWGARRRRAA